MPVSFFLTSITLPKLPLPSTLSKSKSSTVMSLSILVSLCNVVDSLRSILTSIFFFSFFSFGLSPPFGLEGAVLACDRRASYTVLINSNFRISLFPHILFLFCKQNIRLNEMVVMDEDRTSSVNVIIASFALLLSIQSISHLKRIES